jgi:predicted PurR-regulated permease PerM
MSGEPSVRAVVRITMVIVAVVVLLYLLYLVRKPIGWLLISVFLAVALSAPVNYLNQRMRRGFAITIVYLGLLAVPLLLGALILPPLANEANRLADNAPQYARDVTEFVRDNERLRDLNEDYDLTGRLEQEAGRLPERLGGAAGTLRDIGFGVVNSVFALVTILVLTAFILGSGRRWIDQALELQPAWRRERIRRVLDRMANAVGGYVAGALAVAVIAGVLAYIVLSLLGVPFRAPLALIVGLFALIPLVGATVAAVLVGVVTLFTNFPTATIVWTIWSVVYQQLENHLIQPQIQRRAVDIHPFLVVVAVLFGGTLLGVIGAIVAIPVAASLQIALREYWNYRREMQKARGEHATAEVVAPP